MSLCPDHSPGVELTMKVVRGGLPIHAAAAQAAVSFRNFRFSPKEAYATTLHPDAPHIIAAAQIFYSQSASADLYQSDVAALVLSKELGTKNFSQSKC